LTFDTTRMAEFSAVSPSRTLPATKSLAAISVRRWVSFTATECGQKKRSLENFHGPYLESSTKPPVLWRSTSTNCATPRPLVPSECNHYLKLPGKIMCCCTVMYWVNYGLCTVNVWLVYSLFLLQIVPLNTDLTLGYLLIHFQVRLFCWDLWR
jgi:hypothetical protein